MGFFDRFRTKVTRLPAPPTTPTTDPAPPVREWTRSPSPHEVDHTWLQHYNLRATGWLVDVVGESHYQENIEAISGGRCEDGAVLPLVTAQLVRESDNPYDANAVRVDIGSAPVGYIDRETAPLFPPALAALAEIGKPATCRAWLTGGWERGVLDRGSFGVRLDLSVNLDIAERVSILPFSEKRVSITGEEKVQAALEALLDGGNRAEVMAVLSAPGERIEVRINRLVVGALTPKMSARYAGWVGAVQDALLPTTCEARVIRGDRKIEVFLKLATPWSVEREKARARREGAA